MRLIPALCVIVLIAPATGHSQMAVANAVRVDTASRVRVAAPVFGGKKHVATVVSFTLDTLVLREGPSTTYRSIATSDITALEVSAGTYTRKAKGALWGLLIGAGAGAAVGYFAYQESDCEGFECIAPDFGPGGTAALTGTLGGIAGALIGTLIGSRPTEAWVPATVQRR